MFAPVTRVTCTVLSVVLLIIFSVEEVVAKPKGIGSLRGSSSSLDRQQHSARRARLRLFRKGADVRKAVRRGDLERVKPSRYLELVNVSYPYAHPKLALLLRRLGRLYFKKCRVPLVITSLTRPLAEQPRNASARSVHPAGIAVDLRVPPRECRTWLRETLISWERKGLIEATRERRPPHFHIVAILHRLSSRTIASLSGGAAKRSTSDKRTRRSTSRTKRKLKKYRVRKGDSLWALARRWRVSTQAIMKENGLRSSRIDYGQLLVIPD